MFELAESPPPADSCRVRPWWREWEVAALVVFVLAVYFSRLTTLTIRGEESRRAMVACQMLETGDWIVPRQQHQLYFSRPPLGSWPIAVLGLIRGQVDLVAIRLPTAFALLLTTVLVYGYSRRIMTRPGALAAAVAFATMGQVLELGRLAETEATFTLLVASSLLIWHWGYAARWPVTVTWACGYALAALAGMAKGPQGPVYFVGPVFVFLIYNRDWKMLWSRAHLAGVASFLVVLGAWQVPYYLATDLESVRKIWFKLASDRFVDNRPTVLSTHLIIYPIEVLVCMLPWSGLLSGYTLRKFRESLGPARPFVIFMTTCLLVTFPSVWFATGARGRYYMPLYPCAAVLAGLVIDRCLSKSACPQWRRGWQIYLSVAGVGVAFAGGTIATASFSTLPPLAGFGQPLMFAAIYTIAMAAAALFLLRGCTGQAPYQTYAPFVLAGVMGLTYTGAVINVQVRHSDDSAARIVAIRAQLPPGEQLVSFGRVDHLFAYHYGDSIVAKPWPRRGRKTPEGVHYFCFNQNPDVPKFRVGFAWEKVAVIPLDRNHQSEPERRVVIGRRLPEPLTALRDTDRTKLR